MGRALERVWRCITDGCHTRLYYPGPWCPSCKLHGVRAIESKPLPRPRLRHAMELQAAQRDQAPMS